MLQKLRNKWFNPTQKKFEFQNPNPKTKETGEIELKTNTKSQTELKMVNSNSDCEVNPIHHYQKNSHILDIPKQ